MYQKNNIEREIMNCNNVTLPELDKLEELKDDIELLGKRDQADLDDLDKVEVTFTSENLLQAPARAEKKRRNEERIRRTHQQSK